MRCFVAAWPDSETRAGLARLVERVRPHANHGRVMRVENLHLTLAFIGSLPDTDAHRVAVASGAITFAPFDWQLDAIGHFARPRVLWVGGPLAPELVALTARVRGMLGDLEIAYDEKAFVPHVTLLRDVRRYDGEVRIEPPLRWRIADVALFQSTHDERGARYLRVA
jgi:2'-5' RNA ligase